MKLKLDENLPLRTARRLQDLGVDVDTAEAEAEAELPEEEGCERARPSG